MGVAPTTSAAVRHQLRSFVNNVGNELLIVRAIGVDTPDDRPNRHLDDRGRPVAATLVFPFTVLSTVNVEGAVELQVE